MVTTRIWLLLFTLIVCAGARADAANSMMQNYLAAMQQQDIAALKRLIAADAQISLTLKQGKDQMTFTLTRSEFLQQQNALWHFSEQSSVDVSQIQPQGSHIHFQQDSRYLLFHKDYRLHSTIALVFSDHENKLSITSISSLSEEQNDHHAE